MIPIPERVGRYRIVSLIGEGGMARVFLAEHEALEKRVAIKVLREELSTRTDVTQRFLNEARVAASIRHPSVVDVYDIGEDGGHPYIVMELLEGEGLDDLLKRNGPLAEDVVVSFARQVASALIAAHDKGVVHRDLKPSNIFVMRSPAGTIKVVDFGIAKRESAETGGAGMHSTRTGSLIGTPVYMSPEQSRGARVVDQRSDLYSLGCVMYEMVAGRPPFEGEGFGDILFAHIGQPPKPLAEAAGRPVSPGLAAIVHRLLEKQPDARFPNALALVHALDELGGGTSKVAAPPVSPPLPTAQPSSAPKSAPPRTMVLEAPRPASQPPAGRTMVLEPGAVPTDPASTLAGGLPSAMRPLADLFWSFLEPSFRGVERLTPGLFKLTGATRADAAAYEYFALFLEAGQGEEDPDGGRRLGTRTFVSFAQPLEGRLEALSPDRRKVVVTVADSQELGRGVREKMFEYRARYAATVVPFNLAELAHARRRGTLARLFDDRLQDLHSLPDPFTTHRKSTSPMQLIGVKQLLNELLNELKGERAIIALCGPPRSGKTALLDMAETELPTFHFCRVRCAGSTQVSAVADLIAATLKRSLGAAAAGLPPGPVGAALAFGAAAAARQDERLVLVLEDADWLVAQVASPKLSDAERAEARALWAEIERQVGEVGLRVIVSGVRAFRLKNRIVAGWENPLAHEVRVCHMPALGRAAAVRVIEDLGAEGNIRFTEQAIEEVVRLSGGHIDALLRLCSEAVRGRPRRAMERPLDEIRIDEEDVRRAAEEMTAIATTFASNVMPILDSVESDVLRVVAARRPKSVAGIRARLVHRLPAAEVPAALEALREMGLVERREGRERVTVPLLEAWAVRHIDDPRRVLLRDRRLRVATLGLAGTALLAGVYVAFVRGGTLMTGSFPATDVRTGSAGCDYAVTYPRRAAEGDKVSMYVRQDCRGTPLASQLRLLAAPGTVAKFGAHLGATTIGDNCEAPGSCPDVLITVPVELISSASSAFALEVREGPTVRERFEVAKDPLARTKSLLEAGFRFALGLPAALGLIAAYFRDTREALQRLLQVKRPRIEKSPETGLPLGS
jgi:serine/threonine-protein kinase